MKMTGIFDNAENVLRLMRIARKLKLHNNGKDLPEDLEGIPLARIIYDAGKELEEIDYEN